MFKMCSILALLMGFASATLGVATAEEGEYYDGTVRSGYSAPDYIVTSAIGSVGEKRDFRYIARNRGGRDNNWPTVNEGIPLTD
jgi:hypothetical protein